MVSGLGPRAGSFRRRGTLARVRTDPERCHHPPQKSLLRQRGGTYEKASWLPSDLYVAQSPGGPLLLGDASTQCRSALTPAFQGWRLLGVLRPVVPKVCGDNLLYEAFWPLSPWCLASLHPSWNGRKRKRQFPTEHIIPLSRVPGPEAWLL